LSAVSPGSRLLRPQRSRSRRFSIDADVQRSALDAQRQLARVGHHRLPPVDLLIAALADCYELGVLHYDRDYDVLAETTDLKFTSARLAPAGTF
jgi:predicted nucleic acid-binding protein